MARSLETAGAECIDPDTAAAFLAGGLSHEEVARVESHIDACAECRQHISALMDPELGRAVALKMVRGLDDSWVELSDGASTHDTKMISSIAG